MTRSERRAKWRAEQEAMAAKAKAAGAHCGWCFDPWRSVLIHAFRQHVRAAAVAAYYNLVPGTVDCVRYEAIRNGCFKHTCRHCPIPLPTGRHVCDAKACRNRNSADHMRHTRLRQKFGIPAFHLAIPLGTTLLPLPENPRLWRKVPPIPVVVMDELRRKATPPVPPTPTYNPRRRFPLGSLWAPEIRP